MDDNHSLSHSKWNCKYHIVFAPKYRMQIIYGHIKANIGKILRQLCEQKKVNIIETSRLSHNVQHDRANSCLLLLTTFVVPLSASSSFLFALFIRVAVVIVVKGFQEHKPARSAVAEKRDSRVNVLLKIAETYDIYENLMELSMRLVRENA